MEGREYEGGYKEFIDSRLNAGGVDYSVEKLR